ncbi:uncharacterized protein METZ01_LOCUS153634, partial [marine metagenome]
VPQDSPNPLPTDQTPTSLQEPPMFDDP